MERRSFIKQTAAIAGTMLIGGCVVKKAMAMEPRKEEELTTPFEKTNVVKIHEGSGKKVLVLIGSCSINGNTDTISDAFIRGLIEKDHTVFKAYLGKVALEGCRGCGYCQRKGEGKCAVYDGMQPLYPLFNESDVIVMSSPLYFGSINSRIKAFIERLYAISVHDRYPEKETVLLMTAGDDSPGTFERAIEYYRHLSKVFGDHNLGEYCAGGCTGCEKLVREISPYHLEKAFEFGTKI